MTEPNVDIVCGGQFGSEGKGMLVGEIAHNYGVHVRVGASNAGHTVYVDGDKHVVQSIPVAAYANPKAALILGPGALISPDILKDEMECNQAWRETKGHPDLRLIVDPRAHIITGKHIREEQNTDLAARIGSTSTIAKEGIGAATAARVMREESCLTAGEMNLEIWAEQGIIVRDTVHYINELRSETSVLLEGTQGTGLSLTTGDFPYVTSRNPTAAGIAADVGIGPTSIRRVFMVLRTYPIRVAGKSGPFGPGSEETTFEAIGVDSEKTTVTKLTRRIATFSMDQAREAAIINGATHIVLTFGDYIAPELCGKTELRLVGSGVGQLQLLKMIDDIEEETGVEVIGLGTGPDTLINLEVSRNREAENA